MRLIDLAWRLATLPIGRVAGETQSVTSPLRGDVMTTHLKASSQLSQVGSAEACLQSPNTSIQAAPVSVRDLKLQTVANLRTDSGPVSFVEHFARAAGLDSLSLLATLTIARYQHRGGDNAAFEQMNNLIMLSGRPFDVAAKLVSAAVEYYENGPRASRIVTIRSAHALMRAQYLTERESFSHDIQLQIESLDDQVDGALRAGMQDLALELLSRREGTLASWPRAVHDVSHDHIKGDPCVSALIGAEIDSLLRSYSPELRRMLDGLVAEIRDNVFLSPGQRVQAYLQGPPGTGKTHFVRALAGALRLPVVSIRLTQSRGPYHDLAAQLTGVSYVAPVASGLAGQGLAKDECEIVGDLACALLYTSILNPIIFFDEAGAALNDAAYVALLNEILDPDNRVLKLRGLGGIEMDFSRATLIFAGNAPLRDSALRSKLREIHFNALSREAREAIFDAAVQDVDASYTNLRVDHRTGLVSTLVAAKQIVLNVDRDFLVPGVRELKLATASLAPMVLQNLRRGLKPSDDDIRLFVETVYLQRSSVNQKEAYYEN